MGQFIEGIDRHQAMLLPECLNDYVGEDSAVRAIDAFVEMLDLAVLGFSASPAATGRPGYHPGLMDCVPGTGVTLFFGLSSAAITGRRFPPGPWEQCRKSRRRFPVSCSAA